MSSKDFKESLETNLRRFYSLRRHKNQHAPFNQQLEKLQQFQVNRMRQTCLPLCDCHREEALLEYILKEMYNGLDLGTMGRNADKLIRFGSKFISDKELMMLSMELNALSGEIDETMTAVLFEKMMVSHISEEVYVAAHHMTEIKPLRERQIELVEALSRGLDENSKSKVVYSTFKIAKTPAKLAGFGKFYSTLWDGFSVIKALESPETVISKFMSAERHYLLSMFERQVG